MSAGETEVQFQQAVIEAAQLHGWTVAHFRPARTQQGWRTPVQADGKGFPDLVLVATGRVVFAELKSDRGRLTDDQKIWWERLRTAGAEVYVWRPRDWPHIEKTLREQDRTRPTRTA